MRTQISLSPEQHARVKRMSAELGISMAEYLRRLVDKDLVENSPENELDSIVGVFGSGGSDIATERHEAIRSIISELANPTTK